jgi:hypothetical protein
MRRAFILIAACLLAGCSSFNLGGMAYCPHGQDCIFVVRPAAAASAVALE